MSRPNPITTTSPAPNVLDRVLEDGLNVATAVAAPALAAMWRDFGLELSQEALV